MVRVSAPARGRPYHLAGRSPSPDQSACSGSVPGISPLPLGEAGRRPGEGVFRGATKAPSPRPSPRGRGRRGDDPDPPPTRRRRELPAETVGAMRKSRWADTRLTPNARPGGPGADQPAASGQGKFGRMPRLPVKWTSDRPRRWSSVPPAPNAGYCRLPNSPARGYGEPEPARVEKRQAGRLSYVP